MKRAKCHTLVALCDKSERAYARRSGCRLNVEILSTHPAVYCIFEITLNSFHFEFRSSFQYRNPCCGVPTVVVERRKVELEKG